jgi:hypothetical protein
MKGLPTFDNFSFSLNRKRIYPVSCWPLQGEKRRSAYRKSSQQAGRGSRLPTRNLLAAIVRTQGAASLQSTRLRSCREDRPSELPADGPVVDAGRSLAV